MNMNMNEYESVFLKYLFNIVLLNLVYGTKHISNYIIFLITGSERARVRVYVFKQYRSRLYFEGIKETHNIFPIKPASYVLNTHT